MDVKHHRGEVKIVLMLRHEDEAVFRDCPDDGIEFVRKADDVSNEKRRPATKRLEMQVAVDLKRRLERAP